MTAALSSLSSRIFLASLLLSTISIGSALYFIGSLLRAEAEAELQRDLVEAASLVEQQRTMLLDSFARTARLIADLPKLKAAVETGHPPTIVPIALDYQEQAGAELLRIADAGGRVLVEFGGAATGVLEVVTAPITIGLDRPEIFGTLTLGYLLDDERAARFKALTGADIAFAVDGQVRSSTFTGTDRAALAPLLDATMVPRAHIGDAEYAVLVKPLPRPPHADAAHDPEPVAMVLRSRTARMRTLSTIEKGLVLSGALTLLLAAVVSYGVSRTITRPLARLTDHMRQIAATGDLTRKLDLSRSRAWQDEDARVLATTFNTLTDSVARFQHEAAQRERLSSLGRMSTIVAHEIRNPLMIIKGAVRQLRRSGASDDDVREAAADIDEEIDRLNRVVNEVLDFARPVRCERAPTDVNAVCRDAVAAAHAAGAHPAIAVDLDPALPVLHTDGEKLRTVLVNLLANAREAVQAAGGAPAAPGVVLSTARLSDHRAAVFVKDRGAGIAPGDLARIFDPYFTTRRTGTGLGLPIAKNILDALGGTLSVSSAEGAGTTIRLELGDAPAPAAETD